MFSRLESYSASSSSSSTSIDLPQNYPSQPQINNTNLNDYLSQPAPIPQNRYSNQTSTSAINPRARTITNLNNFSHLSSSTNNSNDVLHQFIVGNPTTNSMPTNTSSSGDRCLFNLIQKK